MPDITVSIVNWNTSDELKHCLDSVLAQVSVSVEIYVVDNASTDGSVEMLESEYANKLTLIRNRANVGFGKAHNQSIKLSSSRYVMVLNPDSRFITSDALSTIVAYMDKNADIGMLGPKILNSDNTLQYSARRFPSILAGMFRNTFLDKLFPSNRFAKSYLMSDWSHDEIGDVDWLSGAALVVRKDTIDQIGMFDERFFMYCEDTDWCKRAHDAGWRVVYYPNVTVLHRIGAASDKDPYNAVRRHHKSMLLYFIKYNSNKPAVLLTPLVFLGLWLRAVMTMRKITLPHSENQPDK